MKTSTRILIALCLVGLLVGLWLMRGILHKDPAPVRWEPVNLDKANTAQDSAAKYHQEYENLTQDYFSPIDTTRRNMLGAIIRARVSDSLRKRALR